LLRLTISLMLFSSGLYSKESDKKFLSSWLVKDKKYIFERMDSIHAEKSENYPLSYHISSCAYDYIHAIFEKKSIHITDDDKRLARYECKCFYENYARKYEYKKYKAKPDYYTKLELKNGSVANCRKIAKSNLEDLKKWQKKNKAKPSRDTVKTICNGWLIQKKYSPDSWQYQSSYFKDDFKTFKKKYGKISEASFIKDYCKPLVKKEICSGDVIHNMGILPDYFVYGYPDLNVLFKRYKNSKEVSKVLCDRDEDFKTPSINNQSEYQHSTK
jgi:hypothetical protein